MQGFRLHRPCPGFGFHLEGLRGLQAYLKGFFDSLTAYFNIPHRAGKIYGYFLTLLIFLRIFADSIRKYLYKNTEKKRMGERGKSKMESGKFCKAVSRVLQGSGTEMNES